MLKIATIHSLPEIIQKAKLIEDNVPNKHGASSEFTYFKTEIKINNIPCVINLDVKKTTAKNHFHIHYVRVEKMDSALLTSAPDGQK